jgi:hypothetical protein
MMTIEFTADEIARFLVSPDPEVICIKGRWGVGKTHHWNACLCEAHTANQIALGSYSYVSLFGIDSLDQLKYAIVENSVNSVKIGVEPSLETFQSNAEEVTKQIGRKGLSMLTSLPGIKNFAAAVQSVAVLSVAKKIVCIDDLERKGAHLSIRDVLGLVAHLRERKQCKIALILNEGELQGTDREDFYRFSEKVIDATLEFAPTPEECAYIALTEESSVHRQLHDYCTTLRISNIRVIRKIERMISRVQPLLQSYDGKVLDQAVQSLTVLGWSVYDKASAPTIEFLKATRAGDFFDREVRTSESDPEATWNALLNELMFTSIDEFDLLLLDGIEKGYFDEGELINCAVKLDLRFKSERAHGSLQDAWRLFHDSFENNEHQVRDKIFEALCNNIQHVTPVNLNGTIRLLKELGASDKANEALCRYMEARN